MSEDKTELPSITVQKAKRGAGGSLVEETYVSVKHQDIEICHKKVKELLGERR
jgi:hypothetical protein